MSAFAAIAAAGFPELGHRSAPAGASVMRAPRAARLQNVTAHDVLPGCGLMIP